MVQKAPLLPASSQLAINKVLEESALFTVIDRVLKAWVNTTVEVEQIDLCVLAGRLLCLLPSVM